MLTVLFFAAGCADPSSDAWLDEAPLAPGDSAVVFSAEIDGYDIEADGPLVAQLVEEVPTSPPDYPTVAAQVVVTGSGAFNLELPVPEDESVVSVRYRIVVRERLADGTAGVIREAWQPVLVWNDAADLAGAPAGWSLETRRGGQVSYSAVVDANLELHLAVQPELVVGGPFVVPDVVTDPGSSVRVALLADDEPVEGVVGLVVNGVWGLSLEGDPGLPAYALLRPVAFIDVDGDLAFDPTTEPPLGLACARSAEAFVRWFPPPSEVRGADWMMYTRTTPGWNAWVQGDRGGNRLFDATRVRIDTACE